MDQREKLLASRKRWLLAELAKCEIVSVKNFGGALIGIYFESFLVRLIIYI
jgi:hypothetical protein